MEEGEFARRIFETYCKPAHELSAKGFKKMCCDAKIFDKNFLPVDAEVAFEQVVAEISVLDRADPLHESVIFDKRIEFPIFSSFLLPEVAEMKGTNVHSLVNEFRFDKDGKSRKNSADKAETPDVVAT